jgi:hypothetical protein
MKSPNTLQVIEVPPADRGIDTYIGFLGCWACIGLSDFLKEVFQSSYHLSQPVNIFMSFLDGCMGWLAGIAGYENGELTPKLEAGILQSSTKIKTCLPS